MGTGYKREFEMILLVGLTELKAQISWIDSKTVRARIILQVFVHLTQLYAFESRGQREGLHYRFSSGVPRLNLVFRSDGVVVYDNPSERTVGNAAEMIPSK